MSLFNAIAGLIILQVLGNVVFWSWFFWKIRKEEKKAEARTNSGGDSASGSDCGCSHSKK